MYTCDLHLKGCTVDQAIYNLDQIIKLARKSKERVLCLIVGYGSTGGTSKIKKSIIEQLDIKKNKNHIKDFIIGNELDMFNSKYLAFKYKEFVPIECKKRLNPGEIIVIL